ncbi:rho guanine nucleotide exchange factor 15-like isoform X2 [Heptranchias perlo]|uniref:rho guanine nucleotide exchange factor 15-like isoform X2 n=1 Tax=Heptranchias perlo TaxID=212740 RepID=UPI00355A9877
MSSTVKVPPETEMQKRTAKQQPKPPLKPKPPALAPSGGKQGGAQASVDLEPSARPRAPDVMTGGEVLSGSGHVRKIRERFSKAPSLQEGEEVPAKDKLPQGLKRAESARELPAGSPPVPKARRKLPARTAVPPDVLENHGGEQMQSTAKRLLVDLHSSQEVATGLGLGATQEHSDASEDTEVSGHCPPSCPCMCHVKRPGMVLVWRPAPGHKVGSDESDDSLSDLSESDAKPFSYVLHINGRGHDGASEKGVDGNPCRDSGAPENSSLGAEETGTDAAGAEETGTDAGGAEETGTDAGGAEETGTDAGGAEETGTDAGGADGEIQRGEDSGQPSGCLHRASPLTVRQDGPGRSDETARRPPEAPARRPKLEATTAEERPPPSGDLTPAAVNSQPKPPRRYKPVRQSWSESGDPPPKVPPRRPVRVRKPGVPPSRIRQRYTAGNLDRISKCVDGLNLHVQKMELPRQEPTCPSASGTLKPPSPKVTRSAPPSPKEKLVQTIYDEIDIGDPDDSRTNEYEVHLEILESRSTKTGIQKLTNWESQFESEPLYQTYRETVIDKAIKRQTLLRDSSKTSEDYMYESIPVIQESDKTSRQGPRSQTPQNTLWQNLGVVRESGILNSLSQGECKLQESMFEVLTSEASYLRSLNVLVEHFMDCRDLNETIILRDKKTLFSCIIRVKEVSESFLKDLEDRMDESIKISDVCDIIYYHAQHNFQVYVDYVRNQLYQEQKYSQLMEENAQFAAVIVRLQDLPRCQRLPFMSFLLLPFQRITRIKMLIENILQRSEVGSVNEETASKALGLVSKIIEECNTQVGKMKQMEEIIHIGKKLEFDKLKAIPIISQLRHLEKRGELSEIVFRGNRFGVKPKVIPLYFFLFNDLLLITSKKSGDRYQVVDHAHRSLVEVQECSSNSPGSGIENSFELILLENHRGKQSDRLLKTSKESDRHRWMDALKSGKQNLPEDSKDDKIYECWDCPQMQCLLPYTAQQADELSLEPADIINITRKSAEGWYEGTKLSNGKKGWFPSESVQEITNEHVRRRNLRERYRLLQAAHQLHRVQDDEKTEITL